MSVLTHEGTIRIAELRLSKVAKLMQGGCLCGAVRIEVSGEAYRVGICHCLDCRKHSGSVFSAFAIYPVEIVIVRGTTSNYRGRYFCPACGSSVFGRYGDEIEVHIGSLDAPN